MQSPLWLPSPWRTEADPSPIRLNSHPLSPLSHSRRWQPFPALIHSSGKNPAIAPLRHTYLNKRADEKKPAYKSGPCLVILMMKSSVLIRQMLIHQLNPMLHGRPPRSIQVIPTSHIGSDDQIRFAAFQCVHLTITQTSRNLWLRQRIRTC